MFASLDVSIGPANEEIQTELDPANDEMQTELDQLPVPAANDEIQTELDQVPPANDVEDSESEHDDDDDDPPVGQCSLWQSGDENVGFNN